MTTAERQPLDLSVGGKADELDRVGERIGDGEPVDCVRPGLTQLPQRVERGGQKEHREHHEVHHSGEVLDLGRVDRDQQPDRAEHQADEEHRRQDEDPAEARKAEAGMRDTATNA